jgi:hypothetical protein
MQYEAFSVLLSYNCFPHAPAHSVPREGEEQIDLSTVFGALPPIVSSAAAFGNRARGLERELKAPGAT